MSIALVPPRGLTISLLSIASLGLLGCPAEPPPVDATVIDDAFDALDAGGDAPPDPPIEIPPRGAIALVRHDDGRVDVADDRGTVYVRGAWAEALVREGESESTVSTHEGCSGSWSELATPWNDTPRLADGEGWQWSCTAREGLSLTWRFWIDRAHDVLVTDLSIASTAGSPERTLLRLTPLITEGEDGGLFVGGRVARHRILDDGADLVRETDSYLHYPAERRYALANALPIRSRGDVLANWNHAVVDLEGERSFVAGMLGVVNAAPTFGTTWRGRGPLDETTGRRGFDALYVDCALLFTGKPLHPSQSIGSETIYVDPLSEDPLVGLEAYAETVAAWLDVVPWTHRDGGRPVPNGWNSWSGSSFTGGLGTDIDQSIVRENLAIMARELAPYGIDYLQIDDGYQDANGDWNADPERFPDGIDTLAGEIEAEGLAPGIWVKALIVDVDSELARDHPDWLQDPATAALGGAVSPGDSQRALDVSHPDVRAWLRALATRYRDDWHMRWIKLDFAYQAFLFPPAANPELSSVEAYHGALAEFGDALGDDVFYLGIGLTGMNFGVVDGMRLTLDDGPRWEDSSPFGFGAAGTIKGALRTAARRYYFHDRLWISHADLIFFRTAPESPTLTLEEATTWASFIALSGSIVKIGEDLRTLRPEHIDVLRRLLPSYPRGGRPMDLFTRNYPEEWRLPIEGTLAGSDAEWLVVGLLGWGTNFDMNVDGEPGEMADQARTHTIDLAHWGLDPSHDYLAQEFWSETFLGVVRGALVHEVPAHGHAVIALRERTGDPQLLGHNRHVTQGGTDLVSETWDAATSTLRIRMRVDAGSAEAIPFEHRVRIYAAGRTARVGTSDGITITQDSEVVTATFTPTIAEERELTFTFE